MSFSPYQFIKDRTRSHAITPEEENEFELYTVQMVLENEPKVTQMLLRTNTDSFFKLDKRLQAHSFDCLNGKKIFIPFKKNRTERIDTLKSEIQGYMSEFGMDYNTAKFLVLSNDRKK